MKLMLRERNIRDKKLTMSEMKVQYKCILKRNKWRVAILITIAIIIIAIIIIIIIIIIKW